MSKYVIEIEENPLCVFDKGTQIFFPRLWRVKGFNSLVLDEEGLSRLEELNSDYINEHFGDLQDTAYQRGLSEGNDIGYKDGVKDGQNEAWECAKKLFSTMADSDIEKAFPIEWNNGGFKALINLHPQEAIAKLKAYEQKRADKPIIGEVIERYLNGKRDGVGVFLGEDGDYWNCLFWTGAIFGTFAYPSNQFKRTGNVCDITKILEDMRHD